MLHLNYWCGTEDEKNKINKILDYYEQKDKENSFKYEENIFKKTTNTQLLTNANKKNKWYNKIITFIRRIFKRK